MRLIALILFLTTPAQDSTEVRVSSCEVTTEYVCQTDLGSVTLYGIEGTEGGDILEHLVTHGQALGRAAYLRHRGDGVLLWLEGRRTLNEMLVDLGFAKRREGTEVHELLK